MALETIRLDDFSGGLNLRDNPGELKSNETPSSVNWTLDQHGMLRLRNGCENPNVALPGVSGKPAWIFYSESLDQWLLVRETAGSPNRQHLWTHAGDLTSGSWTDRGDVANTNTLGMTAAFAELAGNPPKVVITSGTGAGSSVGAIYTWDGTTLTTVSNTLGGWAAAVWQNRVWVAGYPISGANGNPTRIFACAPGDAATWPGGANTLTVDLRDKDASIVTALGVAGGALMAYKKRSAYRINDSSTGSYTTVDSAAGCVGPLALVALHGRLYSWGADGLYSWDGISRGRTLGDKCRPLFVTDVGPQGSTGPLIAGGALEDRVLYSYPVSAGGVNTNQLEYDALHGWLMKHTLANIAHNFTSFAKKGNVLYGVMPVSDQVWTIYTGTPCTDSGTAFTTATYRTPWLKPFGGKRFRIARAQIDGKLNNGGTLALALGSMIDWTPASAVNFDVSADLRTSSDVASSVLRSAGQGLSCAFQFLVTSFAVEPALVSALTLDLSQLER